MENVTLKKMINAYGMVLILILLFLALSVSIDGFFSARTVWSIIEQVSMFGIIAIGVTFIIITTGIDLSSGFCGGAYSSRFCFNCNWWR